MRDKSDLERLYDEHANAVFAFLLNFTRDEQDTRDVLQERQVRQIGPGEVESKDTGWVVTRLRGAGFGYGQVKSQDTCAPAPASLYASTA